jgi:hypothetical protein
MLARDLATEARACEDPAAKAVLVAGFQKTSRTVRLTLALDAKLDRDAARDARDAAKAAEDRAADARLQESRIMQAARAAHVSLTEPSPVEIQKRRVTAALTRLIWNEAEGDREEYEVLLEDLDARLDEAQHAPGFADMPLDVAAAKLAADMRLTGELVITTAERFAPANAPPTPPLADTG